MDLAVYNPLIMFDLGIWEFLIVICVGLLVVKPEELPDVVRSIGRLLRKIKKITSEFTSVFDDLSHEAGDLKEIIGDDGKSYKSYGADSKRKKEPTNND